MHTESASNRPYSGIRLIELLQQQHEMRSQQSDKFQGLFKQDTFTLLWRTKVGSFPHPDLETIVSAGEPCGAWKPDPHWRQQNLNLSRQWRPETDRNVEQNLEQLPELPLYGYIPGSAIRGVVRAWAKQRGELKSKLDELLGYQHKETIRAGKIEFLDAWPQAATKLSLDVVNNQQDFQVYHDSEKGCNPQPLYTLGDGKGRILVTVAIRGIPGRATASEVDEVWNWVQQALRMYGVGSRTASGYGAIKSPSSFRPAPEFRTLDPGYDRKQFEFSLYSQGCGGINSKDMNARELRPSHWRGWLRSWVLRFLLGVMSCEDAQVTLAELMGTLEPESRKGCVRLQMFQGETWGERSENEPDFYTWQGTLHLSAPQKILNPILMPIIKFAVSVGGVGRGWRRPLHIFRIDNGRAFARGSDLQLKEASRKKGSTQVEFKSCSLPINPQEWTSLYQNWRKAAQALWSERVKPFDFNPPAEAFSPTACAIYAVPGPEAEPLDRNKCDWDEKVAVKTRGDGMKLIYQPDYKRKIDVGGNAATGKKDPLTGKKEPSYCSWVSIKRVNVFHSEMGTDCQEIVCLFMGGETPDSDHLRRDFLDELAHEVSGAVHLFGCQPSAVLDEPSSDLDRQVWKE